MDFTAGDPPPYAELDFHFVPFSPNDGNGQTKFKDGVITYIATADGTVTVWQVHRFCFDRPSVSFVPAPKPSPPGLQQARCTPKT